MAHGAEGVYLRRCGDGIEEARAGYLEFKIMYLSLADAEAPPGRTGSPAVPPGFPFGRAAN